eukprot:CAMPEP_0173451810 /NCGR_PEP_ID=MMETSP1357-20121228/47495_1 /TAXON_ID=77926 /ORGANISM="Hemiselmis rufescens, Strain PCC563" /LENGTH=34 /DNA_ID= /DNA_START= /DNA_END= /DNA_ORIENTATION=
MVTWKTCTTLDLMPLYRMFCSTKVLSPSTLSNPQ